MSKSDYARKKEEARQEAIDWQNEFGEHSYTWEDLANFQEHFEKLGKRYGLTQEFKENGII